MWDERGVAIILFAVVLPLTLIVAAVVWDAGNWWVHRKHLQTKVDAAAFAGGGVWGFPCAPDIDQSIETTARTYVGEHVQADGSSFTATTFNPQVGGTPGSQIHVVLNGNTWYDDDSGPVVVDKSDPINPSFCESKVLDVKATETNTSPLFGWLPFFPDIKRKARVEIQEVEGLTGLLPIAVRIPAPLSAAAVFYDESNGSILDVKYFRQDNSIFGLPTGLSGWTTLPDPADASGTWASVNVAARTGIAIAASFRPACGTPGATPPCFDISGFLTVDDLCRQSGGSVVQCFYSTGSGATQTVQAGLHFIRGYPSDPVTNGPPELRSVWLDSPTTNCGSYFSAVTASCSMALHAAIDLGSSIEGDPPVETRTPSNAEVRYKLVHGGTAPVGTGSCGDDYQPACELAPSWSTSVTINPGSVRNAIAIRVRLQNTTVPGFPGCSDSGFDALCEWYYTASGRSTNVPTDAQIFANPIQRPFMGDVDRSGGIKWLRLSTDTNCDGGGVFPDLIDGEAASQPSGGPHCFYVDMGLQAGLARDQDEPPIALNLGTGSSQRALVDCDPYIQPDPKEEIVKGCQWPSYAANKFNTTPLCPGTAGFFTVPKLAPFDKWPPFRCVLTQTTAAANQIIMGFNERIFGTASNPTCPGDDMTKWVKGRNYWHRDNNDFDEQTFAWDGDTPTDKTDDWGNELSDNDPRLVTLFFSTYDSFTSAGNETYPVVGFGNFYVTGYGRTQNGGWQGGAPDDPCDEGNDGDLYNGNGNEPPPDLDYSSNTTYLWGHFVNNVVPNPFTTGGSGELCQPQASFQPCVAVLVE